METQNSPLSNAAPEISMTTNGNDHNDASLVPEYRSEKSSVDSCAKSCASDREPLRAGVIANLVNMHMLGKPHLEGARALVLSRPRRCGEGELLVKVQMLDGVDAELFEVPAAQLSVTSGSPQPAACKTQFIPNSGIIVQRSRARQIIFNIVIDSKTELFVAFTVFANFVAICIETDARSYWPGIDGVGVKAGGAPPGWVNLVMHTCFGVLVAELMMRFYADHENVFKKRWNCIDFGVVVLGFLEYGLHWLYVDFGSLGMVRLVRIGRLLRLVRVLRMFSALKELRRTIQMMGSCFKTLFWSFLLLALVMTIWAVLAVEVVNGTVQELADAGEWSGCSRCRRSFSSTFMANLTFFQTVVAGDSWGYMAIPVIEANPWTTIIFVGALLTMVFGVLNLVVAVIVDTFAESRDNDVVDRAADLDYAQTEEKKVLCKLFGKIDSSGRGALSFREVKEGAQNVAEFRHWLRVMDIDERDLAQLFTIVDEDGNGEIDPDEFIEAMYRMRHAVNSTASKFVKHLVTNLDKDLKHMNNQLQKHLITMESRNIRSTDEIKSTVGEINQKMERMKVDHMVDKYLHDHDSKLAEIVEFSLKHASETALETAMEAATMAAKSVMSAMSMTRSSSSIVEIALKNADNSTNSSCDQPTKPPDSVLTGGSENTFCRTTAYHEHDNSTLVHFPYFSGPNGRQSQPPALPRESPSGDP